MEERISATVRSRVTAKVMPTGTVTFLFTDIEGSTQRWDRFGRDMETALRRHDVILREAVERHDGVVFKTIGDAFCVVFGRAESALEAALGLQRDIAREDFSAVDGIRVRAAMHTGTTDERDDDYFGPTVNEVARLVAIGHGGQTLVSEVTASLLRAVLPNGVTLRDLGRHKLKDIERLRAVFQIEAPDLPDDFPPLRSAGQAKAGNLPLSLTSFVGRTAEIDQIVALFLTERLVTLAGMGGVGKTRLACEAARALAERYPDGTWIVELAPLTDPALASARIGEVFGMHEQIGTVMNETWIAALDHKKALLVLDNCEHLIDAVAAVAHRILARCPGIAILATSREPLRLGGERVVRISPLSLPAELTDRLPSIEELAESPAVQLFLERTRTVQSSAPAVYDESARRSLVSICAKLDGIPLAIELAAARVNVLGLRGLAERLDDRFRILRGGSRTALPRQQTLRALIDWSHDLLLEPERRVLRRLSVFAGGWTLEAAQAVCVDEPDAAEAITEWDVFDILSSLVDKSLVSFNDGYDDDTRYSLLETTRAYGLERLTASGEWDRIATAHARYVLGVAAGAAKQSMGATGHDWHASFERELDNVRVALDWTIASKGDIVLGASIAAALEKVFESLGLFFEGLNVSEKAFAAIHGGNEKKLEATLAVAVAKFHTYIGNPLGCVRAAHRAAELLRELGRAPQLCFAAGLEAIGLYYLERRVEADVLATESIALARAVGVPSLVAWALCVKSWTVPPDDFAIRREMLAEALALFGAQPGRMNIEFAYQVLSEVEFGAGNYELSMAYARQGSAPDRRAGGNEGLVMWCLAASAAAAFASGDTEEARRDAREALSYGRRRGSGRFVGATVGVLAGVAARRGDAALAAQLLGASQAQFVAIGRVPMLQERYLHERTHELLTALLAAPDIDALIVDGRNWSVERAVEMALSI